MILSGPSYYVLLLGAIFFSSVFLQQDAVRCEKPAWANVAFDTTKQDAEQLLIGAPSSSLYGSTCQICYSIFDLDFSKRCLEKLYANGTVLLMTISGLFILCLLLRHMKNIKLSQPSQDMTEIVPASEPNNESTQNNQEMLEQLVKNIHKINKYVKLYVIGHYKEEMKSKLSTRKNYERENVSSQCVPAMIPVKTVHEPQAQKVSLFPSSNTLHVTNSSVNDSISDKSLNVELNMR